jgi:hypothetical protein
VSAQLSIGRGYIRSGAHELTESFSDGCGNTMTMNSYGKGFNDRGGGVYATWLDADFVKIWWWKRSSIPTDIKQGQPDPTKWGDPASQFLKGKGCNPGKYFKGLSIVSLRPDLIYDAFTDMTARSSIPRSAATISTKEPGTTSAVQLLGSRRVMTT